MKKVLAISTIPTAPTGPRALSPDDFVMIHGEAFPVPSPSPRGDNPSPPNMVSGQPSDAPVMNEHFSNDPELVVNSGEAFGPHLDTSSPLTPTAVTHATTPSPVPPPNTTQANTQSPWRSFFSGWGSLFSSSASSHAELKETGPSVQMNEIRVDTSTNQASAASQDKENQGCCASIMRAFGR